MFLSILKLFAGSHNRRFLRKCAPLVKRINALEVEYQSLTEEQLKAKTGELKARVEALAARGFVPYEYFTDHDNQFLRFKRGSHK
mgnify:CR=1 FL=1